MSFLLKDLLASDAWIFLATTGAGAGAQGLLWSVPGASAYFAGSVLPYESEYELPSFLGYKPDQYVSEDTAIDMAIAAYMRACKSCKPGRVPVGVGCTASVATTKDHRGTHRSWIAVITGRDRMLLESQEYEKVGPKGREADGAMVDFRIVDMILRAVADKGSSYTGTLAEHVFARPFFGANGIRGKGLPVGAALLPGSFNPLHEGHLEAPDGVTFQLTLKALHKPQVRITEALKRAALINASGRDVLLDEDAWLYLNKARKWPNSTFYIGSDVLEQLLNPVWYSGETIDSVLEEFHMLGTRFRIRQRHNTADAAELILTSPGPWKNGPLFYLLPPSKHAGVSSTQLRARETHGQEQD